MSNNSGFLIKVTGVDRQYVDAKVMGWKWWHFLRESGKPQELRRIASLK